MLGATTCSTRITIVDVVQALCSCTSWRRIPLGQQNREAKPLVHRLAAGLCVHSANCRLAPGARFSDPLTDAKKVIAWARCHAGGQGDDASRIDVAASSAGGQIATMCALTANYDRFDAVAGSDDLDTSPLGAISLYRFYVGPTLAPAWSRRHVTTCILTCHPCSSHTAISTPS